MYKTGLEEICHEGIVIEEAGTIEVGRWSEVGLSTGPYETEEEASSGVRVRFAGCIGTMDPMEGALTRVDVKCGLGCTTFKGLRVLSLV